MTTSAGPAPPTGAQTQRPRRWPTVAEAFDPRHNGLGALRLGLALLVAVTHATVVGFGHQPGIRGTDVSALAVDAFFVISGFLVTASLLRLPLRRYAWHRFLRVVPGFWACLVLTAVLVAPVAALVEGRSPLSVFTSGEDPAWRYVVANSALAMRQFHIAGLGGADGPPPRALDGSLWTLQYEAFCYVVLAGLAVVAGVRRRRWPVLALCAAAWVATVVHSAGGPALDLPALAPDETNRFVLTFLLGAVGHLYARHVPVSAALAAASAAVVVLSMLVLPDYQVLGAPALAYLCLWAAIRLPLPEPGWDLSYGVYIYHWPIQFLLALAGAQVVGEVPFTVLSVVLAVGAASLSWLLVERRALAFKDARWVGGALRRGSRAPAGR